MQNIKLTDIALPEHYLRGKINKPHVQYLLEIAKSSSNKAWPFNTPVLLAKNTAPKIGEKLTGNEVLTTPSQRKKMIKAKTFKAYELIDGWHRFMVMKILKLKDIQADIIGQTDPGKRFLMQYEKNQHGLKLDPLYRSQAIWTMRHIFKLPINDICKETGLHKSSISRIAAKKTGWIVKKKPPAKKVNGGNGDPGSKHLFTAPQYVDRLKVMVDEFPAMKDEIISTLVRELGNKLPEFLQKLRAMTDILVVPK